MKSISGKSVIQAVILFSAAASSALAGQIAHYDLQPAVGTSLADTSTALPFTASFMFLNNASNSASAFSNHFYHNGWGAALDPSKYYTNSILSIGNTFKLDKVDFSLENFSGVSNFYLRSSLDGFAGNIGTGAFLNGNVTNFSVDLSGLGWINDLISFRWYMTTQGAQSAGFANHEPGGAGGGLPDVGQDIRFFGSVSVPDGGSSIALLGLALGAIAVVRRKLGLA